MFADYLSLFSQYFYAGRGKFNDWISDSFLAFQHYCGIWYQYRNMRVKHWVLHELWLYYIIPPAWLTNYMNYVNLFIYCVKLVSKTNVWARVALITCFKHFRFLSVTQLYKALLFTIWTFCLCYFPLYMNIEYSRDVLLFRENILKNY